MTTRTIELDLSERDALYRAYIPSIHNGAVFIRTDDAFRLGDDITLMLSLADEPEPLQVACAVAWITPAGAHGNRPAGIGVRFLAEDKGITRKKIETHLATLLDSDKPTYTM